MLAHCITNQQRPPRQAVLIVAHTDNHLEVFAEKNVDVHFARVPAAFSVEGEQQVEQIMDWMLPPRYRDLHRADRLRKTGSTRPLLPSVLADSLVVRDCLTALDTVNDKEEVLAWTL